MGLDEAEKMKDEDPCWPNYEMIGTKPGKDGRPVPNCVLKKPKKAKPKNEEVEIAEAKVGDTVSFHHELKSAPGSKVKKSGTVEKVDGDVVHVKVKDKYGVKRHQIKMGDLVKEDTELEEASDKKRPPNFTMYPIDRQDYKILRPPKKTPPKSGKEWGRDGGEKKIKEETEQIDEVDRLDPKHPSLSGPGVTLKDRIKKRRGLDYRGDARVRAGQPRSLDYGKKANLPEETEQIDELNKDTVYSYNKKADADIEKKHKSLGQLMRRGDAAGANKAAHQINRRLAGMERAEKRLNSEEVELDELRNVTQDHLGSRMGSSGPGFNKTPAGKESEVKRKQEHLKGQIQSTKSQGGIAGPKGKLPEEVELDEEEVKKVKMTPQERAYKRKLGLKAVVQEAVKKMKDKKGDPSQSKNVKKGEPLSGKQEPVKLNPELQEK